MSMREIRQTMTVPADHVLHVTVPDVPKGEKVQVIVVPAADDRTRKLAQMAAAASDPLYLEDIHEIGEDFSFTDTEH